MALLSVGIFAAAVAATLAVVDAAVFAVGVFL